MSELFTENKALQKLESLLGEMDHKKSPTAKKMLDYLSEARSKNVVNTDLARQELARFAKSIGKNEGYAMQQLKEEFSNCCMIPTDENLCSIYEKINLLVNNPAAIAALELFIRSEEVNGKLIFKPATTNSKTVQNIIQILMEYKVGNISGDKAREQILNAVHEARDRSLRTAIVRLLKSIAAFPAFFLMSKRFFVQTLDVLGYANSRMFGPGRDPQVNELFERLETFAEKDLETTAAKVEKSTAEKELSSINERRASLQEKLGDTSKEQLEQEKKSLEESILQQSESISLGDKAKELIAQQERLAEIAMLLSSHYEAETLQKQASKLEEKIQKLGESIQKLAAPSTEESSAPASFKALLAWLQTVSKEQSGYQWGMMEGEDRTPQVYQQASKLKSSFFGALSKPKELYQSLVGAPRNSAL